MKLLIVLLSILSFTVSVLAELEILELCASECKVFQKCVLSVYADQSKYTVNLYPPKDEFGLCNCQDEDQYFNCLKCYNTKKNKKQYVEGVLKNHCEILKEKMGDTSSNTNPENEENPDNGSNNTDNKNDVADNNKDNTKKGGNGNGTKIGLIILGVVAVAGVAGYVFYSRKQKERPESMPFFGNGTATSPPAYSTLSSSKQPPSYSITAKDMNDTNNLTSDYNTQFYSNVDSNQYTYKYEPSNEEYNDQYDVNYQYGNQYSENNYDNNVVGTTAADTNNVAAETSITINNQTQDVANYESRRESMIPGNRPTSTNIPGHYVCSYKYDPQLDDELALHVDDKVQIIEEYEDGWMKAINLTTGQEGMAPRVCIKEA